MRDHRLWRHFLNSLMFAGLSYLVLAWILHLPGIEVMRAHPFETVVGAITLLVLFFL